MFSKMRLKEHCVSSEEEKANGDEIATYNHLKVSNKDNGVQRFSKVFDKDRKYMYNKEQQQIASWEVGI